MNNKFKEIVQEFSRCIIVGCISFIVDSGVLIFFREVLLTDGTKKSLLYRQPAASSQVFLSAIAYLSSLFSNPAKTAAKVKA